MLAREGKRRSPVIYYAYISLPEILVHHKYSTMLPVEPFLLAMNRQVKGNLPAVGQLKPGIELPSPGSGQIHGFTRY